ncbi:hypothetical protein DFH07DRAFT_954204 [Mycena maculata]|uniref:Uncharacterized protein n=1 Tax=Mycena maculata TaxID=230809 RepID=A0AAD7JU69_9AGAR|nr:hypothetical protein DFH07DRAFT_954204 [Mycena maculata]
MTHLRTRPKGACQTTWTPGKAYLYTNEFKGVRVDIRTRSKFRRGKPPTASNTNLAHIGPAIQGLPYLEVETLFADDVPNGGIHDVVVEVGVDRFLISGYHSEEGPVNSALKERFNNFTWRGELTVVKLGRVVTYRRDFNLRTADLAINKFLAGFLKNVHADEPIPVAYTG